MAILSKLSAHKSALVVAAGASALAAYAYRQYAQAPTSPQPKSASKDSKTKSKKRSERVDAVFWKRLRVLLKIAIPDWSSPVAGYLGILGVFLVLRSFLSIRISEVNGTIVKAIVQKDFMLFVKRLLVLASIAIPASTTNSLLKYLDNLIALELRKQLVKHFHKTYMSKLVYYRVTNVDSRVANPEQVFTEVMSEWGKAVSGLYQNITKPLLDIVLFSRKLAEVMTWRGPALLVTYYIFAGMFIRMVSPSFGALTAQLERLEGAFQGAHNRVITCAEEIAFYAGHEREKETLDKKFSGVVDHLKIHHFSSFWYGIIDGFMVKYGPFLLGYGILGLPVFGPTSENYKKSIGNDVSVITQDYIRNSSLLFGLAEAIGRIVMSHKKLQSLAGYTSLVSELQEVMEDLDHGVYVREMVTASDKDTEKENDEGSESSEVTLEEVVPSKKVSPLEELGLAANKGNIHIGEDIEFDKVPIVTPNGDILLKSITMKIPRGSNLMIVGPNGCGKSSLFRTLGGLWPLFGGDITKPGDGKLFYIPQKPYLCLGTFRDQVIYPDSIQEMQAKGVTDNDLKELLKQVQLSRLLNREGWESEKNWADVLSGGEKQRIAMARLFYHRPSFAILDECTSAVSVDVEGYMYNHSKELGISLITISHRPSLWKYHELKLTFTRSSPTGWVIEPMNLEVAKTL